MNPLTMCDENPQRADRLIPPIALPGQCPDSRKRCIDCTAATDVGRAMARVDHGGRSGVLWNLSG